MANVLPVKEREFFHRNYQLRLIVVGTLITTVALTIGLLAMVPAYIFAQVQLKGVIMEKKVQEKVQKVNKKDTTMRSVRVMNSEIQAIINTKTPQTSTAIEYIIRDWTNTAEDIVISSFIFGTKGDSLQVRVSGEARTRVALNDFINVLQTDSRFSAVVFPVSDLVNNKKIDFSVTMLFK